MSKRTGVCGGELAERLNDLPNGIDGLLPVGFHRLRALPLVIIDDTLGSGQKGMIKIQDMPYMLADTALIRRDIVVGVQLVAEGLDQCFGLGQDADVFICQSG